jgi:DNA-binding transcriptional LysR family regulator
VDVVRLSSVPGMNNARSTPPRLDLNLMVAFHALMETQSVAGAAEQLSVGPQAMSAALARLRGVLGDPLLVRSGRGLARTPVADSLREPVAEALALLAGTLSDRKEFNPETSPAQFTVLASDYVTLVLLRGVMQRLAAEAPRVRLNVRPVVTNFGDHMRSGHADLVILPHEIAPRTRGLKAAPVFEDRFVCVVSEDNQRVGDRLTPRQFRALPYIAYDGGSIPSGAQQQLAARNIEVSAHVTTRSFVVAAFMVEGTEFTTIIHERLARYVAQRAGVRIVEAPFDLAPITETMYWSARTDEDPAHRWLRARIARTAAELDHGSGLDR